MDPVALIFYALVCGSLSAFAPKFGGVGLRMAAGAAVGIVAALVLPWAKSAFGLPY